MTLCEWNLEFFVIACDSSKQCWDKHMTLSGTLSFETKSKKIAEIFLRRLYQTIRSFRPNSLISPSRLAFSSITVSSPWPKTTWRLTGWIIFSCGAWFVCWPSWWEEQRRWPSSSLSYFFFSPLAMRWGRGIWDRIKGRRLCGREWPSFGVKVDFVEGLISPTSMNKC